ncbi:polymorphic toxin-type HINT domain-containing protein [Streptomyces sp. NPDC060010]|uniref:polymorphic toxin-type HINT domain-containing protein n=1 Tax=Streptomyces sp. NPDC060010 TaxID=3347036 RepID=UPI003691C761
MVAVNRWIELSGLRDGGDGQLLHPHRPRRHVDGRGALLRLRYPSSRMGHRCRQVREMGRKVRTQGEGSLRPTCQSTEESAQLRKEQLPGRHAGLDGRWLRQTYRADRDRRFCPGATDPDSGVTGSRRVETTIYTPDDRDFTDIELRDGSTTAPLSSTDHHPYWVENRKRWTDAADLKVGDALRTPVGSTVRIGKVTHWKGLQPAYNLTVNDLHTYLYSRATRRSLCTTPAAYASRRMPIGSMSTSPPGTQEAGH